MDAIRIDWPIGHEHEAPSAPPPSASAHYLDPYVGLDCDNRVEHRLAAPSQDEPT